MVLLIGLAVGVDYSMFYLKREREERAAGRSERAALEAAAATSGRSVLISGLTVIVAMAGMFLTGDPTFASLGVATILVVAIAVLGLAHRPARAALEARRQGRPRRVPLVGRVGRRRRRPDLGRDRRPRPAPAGRCRPSSPAGCCWRCARRRSSCAWRCRGRTRSRSRSPVIQTYDRMQQAFPGTALPANVVVKAPNVSAPAMQAAISSSSSGRSRAAGCTSRSRSTSTRTRRSRTSPSRSPEDDRPGVGRRARRSCATRSSPRRSARLPNAETGVTGQTAQWKDSTDELKSNLPPVVAFVLLFAFGLMLVAFRSIVIAAKAIVLNLLSVAAAYGVLVLVFQHGIGKGLLGFSSTDGIDPVVPLLLFVILFGLSMDYHVLILSRIREMFDRGASPWTTRSRTGSSRTAGVVTSAAIVMVFVFAIFATLSMLFFKQFGVGLAAAILIDATIVRAVLLPATMKLLGDWNWYLPSVARVASPARAAPSPRPRCRRPRPPRPAVGSPVRVGGPGAQPPKGPSHMNAPASSGKKARGGEPKRAFTPARIVGLVLIALARARPRLPPRQLGRRRGLGPCRCEGRRPDPRATAPTPPSRAATPPTAGRSSCPRTGADRSRG